MQIMVGIYGFWTDRYSVEFEGDVIEWDIERTTAEFSYCEENSSFTKTTPKKIAFKKDNVLYITDQYIHTADQHSRYYIV